MSAPERAPEDESHTPDDAEESPPRPDWLVGMDQDLGISPGVEPTTRRGPGPPPPPRAAPPKSETPPPRVSPATAFDFSSFGDQSAGAGPGASGASATRTPATAQTPEPGPAAEPAANPDAPVSWTAAASSIPTLRPARRPVSDSDADPAGPEWEDPEAEAAEEAAATATAVPPRQKLPGYLEAPLEAAIGAFEWATRTPRNAITVVGGAILVIGIVWALLPREHFTALSRIRSHAAELDGHLVNIHGTVGQVFPVGGGYAFFLLQGRDTIVVFTSRRTPVERSHIRITGTVSTGFLDGAPRPAVFESSD